MLALESARLGLWQASRFADCLPQVPMFVYVELTPSKLGSQHHEMSSAKSVRTSTDTGWHHT